ncbi:MAG: alkaline phosphatase family protein [Promethearchaeota archaeon]
MLLVIDGMGYEYFTAHGKGSTFLKHLRGRMTSVFPTTTAAAMTSFYSGVAPLNHGIPAWHTYLQEFGAVSTILPMAVRGNRSSLLYGGLRAKDIFQFESFTHYLRGSSYSVEGTKELSYSSKNSAKFFRRIRKLPMVLKVKPPISIFSKLIMPLGNLLTMFGFAIPMRR